MQLWIKYFSLSLHYLLFSMFYPPLKNAQNNFKKRSNLHLLFLSGSSKGHTPFHNPKCFCETMQICGLVCWSRLWAEMIFRCVVETWRGDGWSALSLHDEQMATQGLLVGECQQERPCVCYGHIKNNCWNILSVVCF